MSKSQEFAKFVDWLIENCKEEVNITEENASYLEVLRNDIDSSDEKPEFTENGLNIMRFLQENSTKMYKAKDIAEGMAIGTKTVVGAIRKLCTDGYVEKTGKSPIVYSLTQKGKEKELIDN